MMSLNDGTSIPCSASFAQGLERVGGDPQQKGSKAADPQLPTLGSVGSCLRSPLGWSGARLFKSLLGAAISSLLFSSPRLSDAPV